MQVEGQQSCDKFCEVKYLGTLLFLNERIFLIAMRRIVVFFSWFDPRTHRPSSFLTSVQHDTCIIKGPLSRSQK